MAFIGQASEMSVGQCGIHDAYLHGKGRSFNPFKEAQKKYGFVGTSRSMC